MNTKGERKIMNLDNIKYVIAQKYYRHKEDYCFVRTLAHEFEGENEVIGYLPLKDELHFNTKKEAEDALKTQPKWVREKHIKTQEYHGYIDSVVTNFQTKLSDVVYVENIEKRQDTEKIIDPKFISLHLEIISSGEENGSDGSDYFAKVKVSDKDTGESLKFICRNIFDFGYVVNPLYKIAEGIDGGVSNEGNWEVFESSKGWYPVRKLSEFETRCLDYLNKFPPITKKIRL